MEKKRETEDVPQAVIMKIIEEESKKAKEEGRPPGTMLVILDY